MSNKFKEKQQNRFDDFADSQKNVDFFKESIAIATEYKVLIGLLKDLKNKSVLDIGCGTGRYSLRIAKYAKEVVGMDISAKSVEYANKKAREYKINNFKGIVSDFSAPTHENHFDYILMVNFLHHTDDINLILKNAKNSLKENGSLVIFEFNPLNLLFIPYLICTGYFKSHFNKEYFRSNVFTLKSYIRKNGFSITSLYRYAYLPAVLYNYSLVFQSINNFLNKIPILNIFCAFHVLICDKSDKRIEATGGKKKNKK